MNTARANFRDTHVNTALSALCDLAADLAVEVKATAITAAVLADRAELAARSIATRYENAEARATRPAAAPVHVNSPTSQGDETVQGASE